MKRQLLSAVIAASLFGMTAQAATITPVNLDPAGQGLNDPTARAPEGGNPGKSVGEQRRIAYQFAADLWGSVLQSSIETRVGASFQPLSCTATSGVLGSAGAYWINADFPNAPLPNAVYHAALANSLAGQNLNAAEPDYVYPDNIEIQSRFNSNLGSTGCLETSGWYYGLDGNTPAGKIAFLDVVLHEIGHGLGVSGFVGYTSGVLGERAGAIGFNDPYTHNAFDNIKGLRFDDAGMTNADRALSIKTRGAPAWDGTSVKSQVPLFLDDAVVLSATGTLTKNFQFFGVASFGPPATAANFNGDVVLVNDGAGADPADACEPLAAGGLTGKVAFINRGACSFEPKTINAQNAGAIAVIIGNVATSGDPGTAPGMAATTNTATIPALSLNVTDANAVKGALPGVNVALGSVAGQFAGADAAGRALLYAPAVVASGSSFSHFETVLTPNALMEPAINDSLAGNYIVDLTLGLFEDEGWGLNGANAKIGTCDTGVKLFKDPGMIAGANVQAGDKVCRASAGGSRASYLRCMTNRASALKTAGLISSTQQSKIRTCASTVTTP